MAEVLGRRWVRCYDRWPWLQGSLHQRLQLLAPDIRQDLIATDAGQRSWAERLAAVLAAVLADPSLDSAGTPAPDVREPRFASQFA